MPNLISPYLNNQKKSISEDIEQFSKKPAVFWQQLAERRALDVFHQAANRVPAYKDFLKRHKINPTKIKTTGEFQYVPYIDKKNYLSAYPLNALVWDGDLSRLSMVSRSSGSSGEPFYWPRGEEQETEVSYIYEIIFRSFFRMHKRKTLVIVGYAMGTWVAGTYTLTTGLSFANQPQPVTFVTPGNNPKEILELASRLGPYFDQVVLCGYPPFVKEVVDTGKKEGVDWSALKLKYIFGAEPFSETFRDHLLKAAGSKSPLRDSMNTIGSADAAILGHETPLSIAVRRAATNNKALWSDLFPAQRIPTLAQYYPWIKYFESIEDDELVFTSNGGIPLLRYNIHDQGGIMHYGELADLTARHEVDLKSLVSGEKDMNLNWTLPFLSVYGKSDSTLPFYGAKLYPENVRSALESSPHALAYSGKFKMSVTQDKRFHPSLVLDVELAPGVKPNYNLKKHTQGHIFNFVKEVNTEFANASQGVGERKAKPKVVLHRFGASEFKTSNIKHGWIKKAA